MVENTPVKKADRKILKKKSYASRIFETTILLFRLRQRLSPSIYISNRKISGISISVPFLDL
jgi:hypothetical protein